MFLSNPAHYLLSFFNVVEILVECSATRSSLKQLKTITVVQSPRKPRKGDRKCCIENDQDCGNVNEVGKAEEDSSISLPYEFVFVLKLWTLFAFVALYSRHIEPLFRYIPGYYIWNTGHAVCKCLILVVLSFPQVPITNFAFQYLWYSIEGIDNDLPYYYNRAIEMIKNQVFGIIDMITATLINLGNSEKIYHFIEKLPIIIVLLIFPCFEEEDEISISTSHDDMKSLALDEKETITLDSNGELLRVSFDDVCNSSSGHVDRSRSTEFDDSLELFNLDKLNDSNNDNNNNNNDDDDDSNGPFQLHDKEMSTSGVTDRRRYRQKRPAVMPEEDHEDEGDDMASANSPSRADRESRIQPETEPNLSDFSSSSSSSSSSTLDREINGKERLHLAPEFDEDVQSALKESSNRLSRFSLLHPRDSIVSVNSRGKYSMSSLQRIKANAKLNYQTHNNGNGNSSGESSGNRRTSRLPPLDTGNGGLGYGSLKKKRTMVKKPSTGFY